MKQEQAKEFSQPDERAEVHQLVGHRWFLESGWCQQLDATDESSMTTAKPSARYGATWRAPRTDGFALPSYTISCDTTDLGGIADAAFWGSKGDLRASDVR